MPGKVLKVLVRDGDIVEAGQPLVVIEAMKMETTLAAESAAIVKNVRVQEGQTIDHGAVLLELSPPPDSSDRGSVPPCPCCSPRSHRRGRRRGQSRRVS